MGPINAVASCYLNILNVSGRARRAEYWWFFLYLTLAGAGLQVWFAFQMAGNAGLMAALGDPDLIAAWIKQNPDALYMAGYIWAGYLLLGWLPQFTVTIRRLHDTNRSGWFIFMPLVAYILAIVGGFVLTVVTAGHGALLAIMGIAIIPLGASIWFFVVLCLPGTHGNNRFGPDPVPNRKRKPPAHPAFAPQLPPEEQAQIAAARQSEIKDYYRKHVLPNIQKA